MQFIKITAFLRRLGISLKTIVTSRGGIQAVLIAWRDRRRQTQPGDQNHTFQARSYSGSRTRHYLVHVPPGNIARRPRPLLMVLHGCRQDNRSIEEISGFNHLADQHGFMVVYPFITSYRGMRFENCWGWWFEREIHAGAGEVEDLWQIIEEIKQRYPVNERRIHVAGLSSGAAMTVAMLVAHADKIASGVSVAGLPYSERAEAVRHAYNRMPRNRPVNAITTSMKREMGLSRHSPALQIIHSKNDETVDIQSAKNLRDSWGHCFGIDTDEPYKHSKGRVSNTDWEHSLYQNGRGKSAIETVFLQGPGHGWYGGNSGDFSYPDAPDISLGIWKFCATHPLRK